MTCYKGFLSSIEHADDGSLPFALPLIAVASLPLLDFLRLPKRLVWWSNETPKETHGVMNFLEEGKSLLSECNDRKFFRPRTYAALRDLSCLVMRVVLFFLLVFNFVWTSQIVYDVQW